MNKKYSKTKLAKFRRTILEKMEHISQDMNDIQEGINGTGNSKRGLSQDSIYSQHMADAGTDSHEKEKNYLLMNRENDYYKNLELALERIDSGEFGVCSLCGTQIPEERMLEVPNTSKCVSCKEKEKLNLL